MTSRNPLLDFFHTLKEFLSDLKSESHIESIKGWEDWEETKQKTTLSNVINNLKQHSRAILLREQTLFAEPLFILPGLDISETFLQSDSQIQHVIWDYIEHLYVFGTLYLRPKDRKRFLTLVQSLKQSQQNLEQFESNTNTSASGEEGNLGDAIGQVQEMFGIQEGHWMGDIVKNIGTKVNDLMSDNCDPQQLMMKLMSGDMSMFKDIMDESSQQLQQKVESGEIDKDTFESQAAGMMHQFNSLVPTEIKQQIGDIGQQQQQQQIRNVGQQQQIRNVGNVGQQQQIRNVGQQQQNYTHPSPMPQKNTNKSKKKKKKRKKKSK